MTFRDSTTDSAVELSRPLVGSSKNTTAGWCTMSTPMLTRRFSPPLKPRFKSSPAEEQEQGGQGVGGGGSRKEEDTNDGVHALLQT